MPSRRRTDGDALTYGWVQTGGTPIVTLAVTDTGSLVDTDEVGED